LGWLKKAAQLVKPLPDYNNSDSKKTLF